VFVRHIVVALETRVGDEDTRRVGSLTELKLKERVSRNVYLN